MTTRTYDPIHIAATAIGLGCVGVEIASNVEHIVHTVHTVWDPAVFAAVAVSIATAVALSCAYAALRQWQVMTAAFLLVGFAVGTAFTLTTTLDRTASARDQRLATILAADDLGGAAQRKLPNLMYVAARACAGTNARTQGCIAARNEVSIAEEIIERRAGELDSMGKRIAALMPWLTPAQASIYQPMLLPVALLMFGSFLVAFGTNGRRVEPEFNLAEGDNKASRAAKAQRFVEAFRAQHGREPTSSEVATALGVTATKARTALRIVRAA